MRRFLLPAAVLLAASLAGPPRPASAQAPVISGRFMVPQPLPLTGAPRSTVRLVGYGAAGGATGLVAGCATGAAMGAAIRGGWGPLAGAAFGCFGGAPAGVVLGIPLGVHLGNDARGSLTLDLIASGAAVATVLTGNALAQRVGLRDDGDFSPAGLLVIPALQLAAVIWTERWSARGD